MKVAACMVLASILSSGCSAPSQAPSSEVATTTPLDAPAEPTLDTRVAEVLASAKKRFAADKGLIDNRPGYERDLQRQLRQRVESQMQARLVPPAMSAEALRKALSEAASDAGLIIVSLTVDGPSPATPVPSEHRGPSAYAYTVEQLFGAYRVAARFGGAGADKVGEWLRAIEQAKLPLPFVSEVRGEGRDVLVEARCMSEHPVRAPRHVIEPLTIASLAADAGVEAPSSEAFGPQLAQLQELIAAHSALLPELERTMAALGASHLEAERFRIYARAADAVDAALGVKTHDGH